MQNKPIRLREMLCGVPYVVVKGSSGTFAVGDHVRRESCDDSIRCHEAMGWLEKESWCRLKALVVLDVDTIAAKIEKCKKELSELRGILKTRNSHDTRG